MWTTSGARHRNGCAHEEAPTKFTRNGDALNLLKLRNGDVAKGKPITAAQFKFDVRRRRENRPGRLFSVNGNRP